MPTILKINLRSMTFRDAESFSSVVTSELQSWYEQFADKILGGVEGQIKLSDIDGNEISASGSFLKSEQQGIKDVYDKLSKSLPNWSWLRGKGIPPPILFIDKANHLDALKDDERGSSSLNDFFVWIVQNSKEMNKLHIVMASNDSFFYEWLNQFVDSGAFRYFFVGHLSEEESRLYWESALFNPKHFEGIPPLRFEEVYKYCGGYMHLMGKSYRMYCYSRGEIEPRLMSHVALRKLKLIEALNTQCISSELLGIMELLFASEQKCVDYNTFCKKICKEKVDILIRHNLVHLRTCSTFSFGNDPNIIFLSLCLIRHVMCHSGGIV